MAAMASAQQLAAEVARWLEERRDMSAALVAEFAECESPSDQPEALREMATLLATKLGAVGFECPHFSPDTPDERCLVARMGPARDSFQLIVGHIDTVWPLGTTGQMPVSIHNGVVRGPGVFDMKGGLAQLVMALSALRAHGAWPSLAPVVFVNTDEEQGSRASRTQLRALASKAKRALILEPAFGQSGSLKTSRPGVGLFEVLVHGRAAHSGLAPGEGVSATREIARLVEAVYRIERDVACTVNVGVLEGGTRQNVVADNARAAVELRANTWSAARKAEVRLRELAGRCDGVRIEVVGEWDRPPMERTPRNAQLWEIAKHAAEVLGIALSEAAVGGASDGNLTSQWTPTLDGLGAVGGGAHAIDEHISVSDLAPRSALLAMILMAP
jgi:glutamate carboxypeptidase